MKFETLLSFVQKGRVKARSIVRGPTTHQLWRFAAHVKGLSREFGICYSCGESISEKAGICPHCNRLQDPPANPDIFLESSEGDARPGPTPSVYREMGATPLVAEDIVVPSLGKSGAPSNAPSNAAATNATEGNAKKGADGFLTAADLAAAFKLDFEEPKTRKHKKAPVAPIAMTRGSFPTHPPRRRRRWGVKLVLFLLLLASVGAGAFQYQRDPTFHNQVNHWYEVSSTWTRQKWAELQKPAINKPQHSPSKPQVIQVDAAPLPSSGSPSAVVPQTTRPDEHPTHHVAAPVPASSPSPWDQIYHQGQDASSQPGNSAKPAKIEDADPARVDTPAPKPQHVGNIDDVWKLYRGAMDAEAQGDYPTAVAKYEQIQQFPKDLWPRDLQLRLTQVRKLASH
jgi:hypothetical protein